MQLSNERMRHTGAGTGEGDYSESQQQELVEDIGRVRSMNRDLSTAQEREEYGKVGKEIHLV